MIQPKTRILCIDDEPVMLNALRGTLEDDYEVLIAGDGASGVERAQKEGPFAVVISDMRMPGMDGAETLSRIRAVSPDTTRIMLTGNSDIQTAIEAVNRGNVFRFLTKPCVADDLLAAVRAGIEYHNLVTAEHVLLQKTLGGSVRMLVDILAIVNPAAFGRAMRVRRYVTSMVRTLNLSDRWMYEVAAMLSQIGCVAIPGETLERMQAGDSLTSAEAQMIREHPLLAQKLIATIPRLETVAEIIVHQADAHPAPVLNNLPPEKAGALILRTAIDFDVLVSRGMTAAAARKTLAGTLTGLDPAVLAALETVVVPTMETALRSVDVKELHSGMRTAEEVRTRNGVLVVGRDQAITETLKARLINFAAQDTIQPRLRVQVMQRGLPEDT